MQFLRLAFPNGFFFPLGNVGVGFGKQFYLYPGFWSIFPKALRSISLNGMG
jgi:hypothetical protein